MVGVGIIGVILAVIIYVTKMNFKENGPIVGIAVVLMFLFAIFS